VGPVRRSGASAFPGFNPHNVHVNGALRACWPTQALGGVLGDDVGRGRAVPLAGFFSLGEDALAWDDDVLSRGTMLVALRLLLRL
jgi:hypothetical protein